MHSSTTQNPAAPVDRGLPTDRSAPTPARPPAIAVRGLHKSFPGKDGRINAVAGVDLTIGHGEIVAFLGPNGAGKTTTLDIVLGLVPPDAGSVSVMGATPRDAVLAGKVSALLQTGGLLRDLTVAETVRYVASTFTAPRPVQEVLEPRQMVPA